MALTNEQYQAASTLRQSRREAAVAEYDIELEIADTDRALIRSATEKFEAACRAASQAYNDVVFPGVF